MRKRRRFYVTSYAYSAYQRKLGTSLTATEAVAWQYQDGSHESRRSSIALSLLVCLWWWEIEVILNP